VQVFQVGQRSYYQWKSQSVSDRNKELCLLKKILFILSQNKRYGSPRMTVELVLGSKVSELQWLNI
jgi:hypothetical protein